MLSVNGASDFSSSTKRWKRNNAFSEIVLVVDLSVSALKKFPGYETVINLTGAFCAVDNTCIMYVRSASEGFQLWNILE